VKKRKKKNFHFSFSLSWISPFVTLGEILFHCELWIEMVGSTGDFTSWFICNVWRKNKERKSISKGFQIWFSFQSINQSWLLSFQMQVVLLWLIFLFSFLLFLSFLILWLWLNGFFLHSFSSWRTSTWMTRQERWWARVSLVITRMNDSAAEAEGRSKGHSCGREMERDKRGRRMERVDSSQTGRTTCCSQVLAGGEGEKNSWWWREWSWREVACSTWQDCAWNPCRKSKLSFLLLHPLS